MNKRTLHFRIGALLALVAVSVLLGSCSSSSSNSPTSGNTGTGGNLIPKSGTTYTYDLYQTDSTGAKVAGSDTTVVATVTATGLTYNGKTNVYTVSDNGSTIHLSIEQNGDLQMAPDTTGIAAALGTGSGVLPQWLTFFTGSKVKGDLQVFDTTFTMKIPPSPIPLTIELKIVTGYLSDETVTVGSEALACAKVHMKITASAVGTVAFSADQIYSFCPKIGYFAKEITNNSKISVFGFEVPASGSAQVLTSYHLN